MNSQALIFIGISFELAALVVGALYLGDIVDKKYSLNGLATVGILFAVMGAWVYHLVILVQKFSKEQKKHEKK